MALHPVNPKQYQRELNPKPKALRTRNPKQYQREPAPFLNFRFRFAEVGASAREAAETWEDLDKSLLNNGYRVEGLGFRV